MVEITSKCNLDCGYCYKSRSQYPVDEMSWDVFLSLKERLKFVDIISFCGMGEQLLHPKFYDMVAALKEHQILVITNGTIPIDYEKLLKQDNIHSIAFSVDGSTEEIAHKSCYKYDYDTLIENLENGSKYGNIPKGINCVIGPDNLGDLVNMIDLTTKYKLESINFLLPTHNPRWVKKNTYKIKDALDEARKYAKEKGILYSDTYFSSNQCTFEKSVIPFISLSGNVRPCCGHSSNIPQVGNLLEKTYDEIWGGDVYSKFREGYYCLKCEALSSLTRMENVK